METNENVSEEEVKESVQSGDGREFKIEEDEKQISKEDFEAYEEVRSSGVTNMFMVTTVCDLSGLDKDKVLAIMKEYDELVKRFPDVRGEE